MTQQAQGFKRINFFKGFLTTEKDWNDAERYHIDKRRLHNRMMHSPGIVYGYAGDLRVTARARGDLSVEVQPGYAIDGMGNDLMIQDATIRNINLEEFKLPQTIYIVLRYYEELTDFIAYKENLEYKGHRRVLESCKVEVSQTEPDIRQEVELGRILLEKNATRLRDARDPTDPRANEIDLRFAPRAGVAGSFMDPPTRLKMTQMLASSRKALFHMARDGRVMTAHDALSAVLSASSLLAADKLDMRNAFDVLSLVVEMQSEISADVEINHPQLAQKSEFANFRKNTEILKGLIGERRATADAIQNLCAYGQKSADIVASVFAGGPPVAFDDEAGKAARPAAAAAPEKKSGMDWEAVKVISSMELPATITVEGREWSLVDKIDVMDKDSEEQHNLS